LFEAVVADEVLVEDGAVLIAVLLVLDRVIVLPLHTQEILRILDSSFPILFLAIASIEVEKRVEL